MIPRGDKQLFCIRCLKAFFKDAYDSILKTTPLRSHFERIDKYEEVTTKHAKAPVQAAT